MKLKLKEKEYELYDSIGELTIEQFRDISKFRELYSNGEFTEIELITEVISTLTGISSDDLMQLELNSFNELYTHVIQLLNQDYNSFIDISEFKIDGKEYKFDSKLDIMPFGMWIDIIELSKKDFWENSPKLFSMLIRPYNSKTKTILKYDIQEIESRVELFYSKLKLKHFYPVYNFFLTFWVELQKRNFQTSSKEKKKK